MRFEIIGKNVEITEAMKTKIESKLSVLDKYLLIDEDTIARVVVKINKQSQKIEVTIPAKVGILRSEVEHNDLYAAIDLSMDKLEDQIRRQKTRLSRKHKDKLTASFIEQDDNEFSENDVPVKTKTIIAEEMEVDEAIMRMEMLGHSFFIYTDEETQTVSVVYRRHDGGYGLIETQ
ncbi:MAG: ribosome hibernation-promoting factor, HPF/YfiA family [Anaerorhabdus sp.]